jgi:hypothetical protein
MNLFDEVMSFVMLSRIVVGRAKGRELGEGDIGKGMRLFFRKSSREAI